MKIHLHDIPENGEHYVLDRTSRELDEVLKDLIGTAPYFADFFIKPLNSRDFELTGTIRTETPELCSRCGINIQYPVNARFHEYLIPKQDHPRNGKYGRVHNISERPENAPEVSEYEGTTFDIGEYLHEIVGLAAPFNVAGPENENGDCSICEIPVRGRTFSYDEKMPEESPKNPFAALKNIKLN